MSKMNEIFGSIREVQISPEQALTEELAALTPPGFRPRRELTPTELRERVERLERLVVLLASLHGFGPLAKGELQ